MILHAKVTLKEVKKALKLPAGTTLEIKSGRGRQLGFKPKKKAYVSK